MRGVPRERNPHSVKPKVSRQSWLLDTVGAYEEFGDRTGEMRSLMKEGLKCLWRGLLQRCGGTVVHFKWESNKSAHNFIRLLW